MIFVGAFGSVSKGTRLPWGPVRNAIFADDGHIMYLVLDQFLCFVTEGQTELSLKFSGFGTASTPFSSRAAQFYHIRLLETS
jgi:hypothetical protein